MSAASYPAAVMPAPRLRGGQAPAGIRGVRFGVGVAGTHWIPAFAEMTRAA
jgi:hypothetical protein